MQWILATQVDPTLPFQCDPQSPLLPQHQLQQLPVEGIRAAPQSKLLPNPHNPLFSRLQIYCGWALDRKTEWEANEKETLLKKDLRIKIQWILCFRRRRHLPQSVKAHRNWRTSLKTGAPDFNNLFNIGNTRSRHFRTKDILPSKTECSGCFIVSWSVADVVDRREEFWSCHTTIYIFAAKSRMRLQAFIKILDGEPICYCGPHGLWDISGGTPKLINFILKFNLYLPKENKERKPCQGAKETSLDSLSTSLLTSLSWSIVLSRCCVLTWVTKILMRAKSNLHAGRIWPAGRRFPSPDLTNSSPGHITHLAHCGDEIAKIFLLTVSMTKSC